MADPRTNPVNNPLQIQSVENIHGTNIANTEAGVKAYVQNITAGVLMRERDRVAGNARRARGDYGIELSAAHAALQSIREGKAAEYPADTLDDTWDAVTRAIRYGFDGYIADQIDASVDALNAYASELANELIKLAEAAYTIRNGRTSDDS